MSLSKKMTRVKFSIALVGCSVILSYVGYTLIDSKFADADTNTNTYIGRETNAQQGSTKVFAADYNGFSSEIVDLTKNQGQNYFVEYRIKREQYRQEKKEMLEPLLTTNMEETRTQAQKYWLELCEKVSKEGEVENVLKIKGYKDVVAEVNSQKVSVTILSNKLTIEEIVRIKGVTADITGFSSDRVEVMTICDVTEQ